MLLGCSSKVNNAFPFVDEQEVRTKSIDLRGINRPCLLAEGTPFSMAFFKTTYNASYFMCAWIGIADLSLFIYLLFIYLF